MASLNYRNPALIASTLSVTCLIVLAKLSSASRDLAPKLRSQSLVADAENRPGGIVIEYRPSLRFETHMKNGDSWESWEYRIVDRTGRVYARVDARFDTDHRLTVPLGYPRTVERPELEIWSSENGRIASLPLRPFPPPRFRRLTPDADPPIRVYRAPLDPKRDHDPVISHLVVEPRVNGKVAHDSWNARIVGTPSESQSARSQGPVGSGFPIEVPYADDTEVVQVRLERLIRKNSFLPFAIKDLRLAKRAGKTVLVLPRENAFEPFDIHNVGAGRQDPLERFLPASIGITYGENERPPSSFIETNAKFVGSRASPFTLKYSLDQRVIIDVKKEKPFPQGSFDANFTLEKTRYVPCESIAVTVPVEPMRK